MMGEKKKTAVNGEFSINKLKQFVVHFTDAAQWINKMDVLNCIRSLVDSAPDLTGMPGIDRQIDR